MSCGLSSFQSCCCTCCSDSWLSPRHGRNWPCLCSPISHAALRWHRAKLSILTEDGYLMHVNNECSNLLVSDACNGFLLVRRDPEENIEGCLGKVSYYVLFILSMEEVSLSHILGTTVQGINSPWLPHARFRPQDFTSLQSDHIWRQALGWQFACVVVLIASAVLRSMMPWRSFNC